VATNDYMSTQGKETLYQLFLLSLKKNYL